MSTVNEKMTALANEVRIISSQTAQLGIEDMTNIIKEENLAFQQNIAQQETLIQQIIQELDNRDLEGGGSYDQGFEEGKKEEHRLFWEQIQPEGRTNYELQFAGSGWNNETFKPLKNFNISNGYMMFWKSKISGSLPDILSKYEVELDTSNSTSVQYMFSSTLFTKIGKVDLKKVTVGSNLTYAFQNSKSLETIEEIVSYDFNTFQTSTFQYCSALRNIRFTGTIASDINFSSCPLSEESMISVIEALKSGAGKKVTFTEACWSALENQTEKTPPEGYSSWRVYVQDGLGWTT